MTMQTLKIKNMVCDRCKAAVRTIFESYGAKVKDVELGIVELYEQLNEDQLRSIHNALESQGFELLTDSRIQTVERIKTLVIEMLRYGGNAMGCNVSAYLSDKLHSDYSALSKLFSSVVGTTIEKYVIAQKVELVKELVSYGELSLTEIATRLGYSSVAYLSAQFKSVTGLTPSQYKASQTTNRKQIDKI